MEEEKRQYKRIAKPLTMQFSLNGGGVKKWDMSIIENISVGGVKFSAFNEFSLDQTIEVRIKIPEIAPHVLELQAVIVNVQPRQGRGKYSDISAKFVNLTDSNKSDLAIIDKIIHTHESKHHKEK